ncbi:MAG: hypothetical protein IJF32_05885 [Oscillospiraceae bacterium]|nr:hypothetical protein [Oscillospiraceae bacterium]
MKKYELTDEQELGENNFWEEIEEEEDIETLRKKCLLREVEDLREQRDMWRRELAKRITEQHRIYELLEKMENKLDRMEEANGKREDFCEELYNNPLEKEDKPNRKEWKAFHIGVMSGIGAILLFLLLLSPEVISKVF